MFVSLPGHSSRFPSARRAQGQLATTEDASSLPGVSPDPDRQRFALGQARHRPFFPAGSPVSAGNRLRRRWAQRGALLAAVYLPMRGHPQRASTTGRALEHLAGTPHGLGGPCGRRLPPSPRVQDWHKFSPRSQLTPVTLAGQVPSPGRQKTSTAQSSFTGRDRGSCVALERARPWPLPAAVDLLYYPHVRARPAANFARATGKPRTSWRGQFRPVGLLAREYMSGTSAYDQLSVSVAQVTASLQACDTPTPAGQFTGRQRRTTGWVDLAVAWSTASGDGITVV